MEDLSLKEHCETLSCVMELVECPVCTETLTPEVTLCVNGHAVCMPCRQQLPTAACPKCRASFATVKPTLFTQLIEALPHTCRQKNCNYFVRTKDDHEKYCTWTPTKCRYCSKSPPQRELVDHIRSTHQHVKKYFFPVLGNLETGVPFDPKKECTVFTPILVEGHFFWGEMKNEPRIGKLTAVFHPVGNGKTSTVFQGTVKLGSDGGYRAVATLNMDPAVNPYIENCICLPTSNLQKYTSKNGELDYRLNVDIIKLESLVSLVQSGIKKGVEMLSTIQF